MIAATVVIPTWVVVCVIAYLVGAYVSLVIFGWQNPGYDMDELDVFTVILWPIFIWIAVGARILDELLTRYYRWSKRHQVAVRRIAALLFWITLPFRPMRIGAMIGGRKGNPEDEA